MSARLLRGLRWLAVRPIRFYQVCISPWTPATCRFKPTCSQYAAEAIESRGIVVGLFLASWRILRCHPFSKGGWDPVPPRRARGN